MLRIDIRAIVRLEVLSQISDLIWNQEHDLLFCKGRAIAQAVSRWLSTAAARVRTRVWSNGICRGQSGSGAGFLRVLRFSLPSFIPPKFSFLTITRCRYNRPEMADMPSGPSLDSTPHYVN
jgi:hypothetical protein